MVWKWLDDVVGRFKCSVILHGVGLVGGGRRIGEFRPDHGCFLSEIPKELWSLPMHINNQYDVYFESQ